MHHRYRQGELPAIEEIMYRYQDGMLFMLGLLVGRAGGRMS